MADTNAKPRFARIFRENVSRRSRTAKGVDATAQTDKTRKPLLLQGEALKARMAVNTELLIADVLADHGAKHAYGCTAVRARCERWFDLATDGLYGPDPYADRFAELRAKADTLGIALGTTYELNRRYRLWTPTYNVSQVSPVFLERHMQEFYEELAVLAPRLHDPDRLPRALAYADVLMDGELHPWLDGCARVSTALVMWLAALNGSTPPLFGPREEHYATITDLDAHERYMSRCLARAAADMP